MRIATLSTRTIGPASISRTNARASPSIVESAIETTLTTNVTCNPCSRNGAHSWRSSRYPATETGCALLGVCPYEDRLIGRPVLIKLLQKGLLLATCNHLIEPKREGQVQVTIS